MLRNTGVLQSQKIFVIKPINKSIFCQENFKPDSKRSSYKTAKKFPESPSYELHDVCDFRTDLKFITKQKMRNIEK
jgi:hypothetical protein